MYIKEPFTEPILAKPIPLFFPQSFILSTNQSDDLLVAAFPRY